MSKLSHKELIETLISKQEDILSSCDHSYLFYCMLSDLTREELLLLRSKVEEENGLYQVIESLLRKKHDTSLDRAEYKDLLRWYKEGTKGKIARARTVLKSRFDYLSTRERRGIIDAFLEKGKPSDRKWVYKKLTNEWDEQYKSKIEELWNEYHDDDCAMLIIRHFSLSFIFNHREELDNDISHYWLFNRLAQLPSFDINSLGLSSLEYLRLVCYSKRNVSDNDVRVALYRVVCNIVKNEEKLDDLGDVMNDGTPLPNIHFCISTYDYENVKRALWYIGKTGYPNVLLDYCNWTHNNSYVDNVVGHSNRISNYRNKMFGIAEAERQSTRDRLADLFYQEFYSFIVQHFPEEYKWMFDDANPNLKNKAYLNTIIKRIENFWNNNVNDFQNQTTSANALQVSDKEAIEGSYIKSPDETYKLVDNLRQKNEAIDMLVQNLGLTPIV